jgi:hypothetical protein
MNSSFRAMLGHSLYGHIVPTRAVLPLEGNSPITGREIQPKEKERKLRIQKEGQGSKP